MPYIPINDGEIFYRERGQGKTAFFITAYLLDSTTWIEQLAGLSSQRRCIAPDFMNHGQSDPGLETALDPELDARRLLEFIDKLELDDTIDLVGLGAGGVVAALMYEARPALFSSVSFLSTNFVIQLDASHAVYRSEMARIAVVEGKDALFRRYDQYIVGSGVTLHARARYKSMLFATRFETIVALLNSDALDARPSLPSKIQVPVLLPYGIEDAVMTEDVVPKMLAQYPDARVVAVEKAGRLLPLENSPALNAALLAFWKEAENT